MNSRRRGTTCTRRASAPSATGTPPCGAATACAPGRRPFPQPPLPTRAARCSSSLLLPGVPHHYPGLVVLTERVACSMLTASPPIIHHLPPAGALLLHAADVEGVLLGDVRAGPAAHDEQRQRGDAVVAEEEPHLAEEGGEGGAGVGGRKEKKQRGGGGARRRGRRAAAAAVLLVVSFRWLGGAGCRLLRARARAHVLLLPLRPPPR